MEQVTAPVLRRLIRALEFRTCNEVSGHLGKRQADIQCVRLVSEAGQVGRAVEGSLIEAIGLTCVALDIQRDARIAELHSLNIPQHVSAFRAGLVGDDIRAIGLVLAALGPPG